VDVALTDGAVADISRLTAAEARVASLWLEDGSNLRLDGVSEDVPTALRGGLGWAAWVDGSRLSVSHYDVFSFDAGGFRVVNGTLVLENVEASNLRGYGIWSTDSTDSLTGTTFSIMPRYLNDNTAGYGVFAETTAGEKVFWASESRISGSYRSGIKAVGAGQRIVGVDLIVQENGGGYVAGEYSTPLDPVRGAGVSLSGGAAAQLTGGELFANEAVEGGGLAVLDAASSATLSGVLVRSNSAVGPGGGLYVESGQVDFSGANLESNRAQVGGGLAVIKDGVLTMAGGDIVGGQASAAGAGAYVFQASATFTDGVDFRSCTVPTTATGTPGRGGGIYVSEASLTLQGSTFTNCSAKQGAAFYAANLSQDLAVSDCAFLSNTSSGNAALYALDLTRTLRLERCVFADNEINVPDLTAASSIYSRQDLPGGRVILSACTVTDNRNGGGAIYQRSGEMEIHESVVAFNRPSGLAGRDLGFVAMSCNDFFSNAGLDYGAGAVPGPGSFSADPLFCDLDNLVFTVDAASPLLPANNDCGVQIGALGQGCSSNP